jgi:hypothetical protein
MTDEQDDEFDDALRALPERHLSDEARHRHRLMLAALAGQVAPKRRFRTRKAAIIVAAAVTLSGGIGVGTAAALGAFSSEPPTDRRVAYCYVTDALSGHGNREDIGVATSTGGRNPSLRDAATSALDICRGGWQQGRYSSTDGTISLNPKPPPWNYPVPPLVPCVLPSGEVGVFPGTDVVCQQLGLPVAEI